jgi:uncharacterized membrane protein YbhN (UPF0104 family)
MERHLSIPPLHDEQESGSTVGEAQRPPQPATARRRVLSILGAAVGVVAAVATLRAVLPHPADVVAALRTAAVGWLALAAVAEALSMSMFAWQQRWRFSTSCLIAVGYAFGLTLSVVQFAGAYLAVQIVRQIPITPGGIGLIEASLLLALVTAGAPTAAAAAVVLVDRVLSCWLIVPAGLLAWAALQSTGRASGHRRPLLKECDA